MNKTLSLALILAAIVAGCTQSPSVVPTPRKPLCIPPGSNHCYASPNVLGSPTPAPTWGPSLQYSGQINAMVAGHDGAMWATLGDGTVSRIDPQGNQSFYTLGGSAQLLTPNPDGNLYVSETMADGSWAIAQVNPLGKVVDYPIPGSDLVRSMTTGSDGAIWMTRSDLGETSWAVGRIDTFGKYEEFQNTTGGALMAITRGADKNLWCGGDVRVSVTNGTMTLFPNGVTGTTVLGSDGLLWDVETSAAWSVDVKGNATSYTLKPKERGEQVGTAHMVWWVAGRATPALHGFNTRHHRISVNVAFPPGVSTNPGPLAVGPDKMLWAAYYGTIYRLPIP